MRRPAGGAAWSGPALALGQLALMAVNLLFTLTLAYAGGLAAVGATAPAVLAFQLTCGMSQRTLAEATLLARASADAPADTPTCRRAVAAALATGTGGALVALAATAAVPGGLGWVPLAYVIGVPFAIALDIGRSAGVAAGSSRAVFVETALWLAAQTGSMVLFAALRAPLGVCLGWAAVNAFFVLAAAVAPHRRPLLAGTLGWVRSARGLIGPASLDALIAGLTPLIALQLTAFVASAATLGAIRLAQQLFAPLALVSITLRRVLVYRRTAADTTAGQDLRDGLTATALMAAGGALLSLVVVAGGGLLPVVGLLPSGLVLVAASVEKMALGFSFGTSLSRFVRGEFGSLLRARYAMLAATALAAPLLTMAWGVPGYLVGSAAGMVLYSLLLVRDRDAAARSTVASPPDPAAPLDGEPAPAHSSTGRSRSSSNGPSDRA